MEDGQTQEIQAKKINYNPLKFDKKISKLKGLKKDNFDENYLIK